MKVKIVEKVTPKTAKASYYPDAANDECIVDKKKVIEKVKETDDSSTQDNPEERPYHLNAGGLQLTGRISYKDVSRHPRGLNTSIYYLDDFGFTESKDKEDKGIPVDETEEEVVDNSDMPDVVVLSIEASLDDILKTLPPRKNNNKHQLEHVVEDIVTMATVNANYNDNLLSLVEMYLENLEDCPEKEIAQEEFGHLMLRIADDFVRQLKTHRLFSLDDCAYYQFNQMLSPMLIVLRKVNPRDFLGMD